MGTAEVGPRAGPCVGAPFAASACALPGHIRSQICTGSPPFLDKSIASLHGLSTAPGGIAHKSAGVLRLASTNQSQICTGSPPHQDISPTNLHGFSALPGHINHNYAQIFHLARTHHATPKFCADSLPWKGDMSPGALIYISDHLPTDLTYAGWAGRDLDIPYRVFTKGNTQIKLLIKVSHLITPGYQRTIPDLGSSCTRKQMQFWVNFQLRGDLQPCAL